MPFWVYLLRCADGAYYAGHTDDLERRFAEHEQGTIAGHTSLRRPVLLVYSQEFSTREDALAAERQIKRWSRRKKEALIAGDFAALQVLRRRIFTANDRNGTCLDTACGCTRHERAAGK